MENSKYFSYLERKIRGSVRKITRNSRSRHGSSEIVKKKMSIFFYHIIIIKPNGTLFDLIEIIIIAILLSSLQVRHDYKTMQIVYFIRSTHTRKIRRRMMNTNKPRFLCTLKKYYFSKKKK